VKKLLKALSILLGLVVALVVAAVIVVPMVLDPNDYKDEIKSLVEKETGRKLDLGGDIKLSLFPWLGLELGPLALGNAAGFTPEAFLKAKETRVHVALLPLLRKEVQMDTVTMTGLVLNLSRDQAGKSNWDDLVAKSAGPEASKEAEAPTGLAAFALGGIDLSDAEVTWDDRQKGERYAIRGLDLKTDAIRPGEPVDLTLGFSLASAKPAMSGDIRLKGTVMADLEARRHRLAPFEIGAKLKGEGIPGGEAQFDLSLAALDLDLGVDSAKLTGFKLRGLDVEAEGDVTAGRISTGSPALEGKLALKAPKLSETLKALGQAGAAQNVSGLALSTPFKGTAQALVLDPLALKLELVGATKGPTALEVSTRADIDLAKGSLALERLSAKGLGLDLSGSVRAQELKATPRLEGQLKLATMSPRELMSALGIEAPVTADPKVLTRMSADLTFKGSKTGMNLEPVALKLDDTSLSGSLGIADFEKQALRFRLAANAIDLDRYLPPKPEGEGGKAATPGAAAGAAAKLPVEMLRGLDIQGSLKIGSLKASNLKLQNLVFNMDAKGGAIKMSPLSAGLYGGQYQGNVGLDVRGAEPKVSLDEALTGVQIEPLLMDLNGEAKLRGRADIEAQLVATGADPERMKKTLAGRGALTVRDGAYKGVNIGQLARQGKALLDVAKGKSAGAVQGSTETDFSELSGTFEVAAGVLRNEDLAMKAPLMRLAGKGTADLGNDKIDYTLNASLVESSKGQEGKDTEKLKGITVPIRVTGSLSDPKFTPDLAAVAKAQAAEEIDKQTKKLKGKVEKEIKEKLGDDVGDKLKDLLKF
jgi:AsmA protein